MTFKKTLLFSVLLSSFLPAISEARSPAIEPVMGISIEEYNDVHPDMAKGYDFNSGKARTIGEHPDNTTTQGLVERRPARTSEEIRTVQNAAVEKTSSTPYWIGVLLAATCILMPLAIWGLVFKPQGSVTKESPSEVWDLEAARNLRKEKEEQERNIPKAS